MKAAKAGRNNPARDTGTKLAVPPGTIRLCKNAAFAEWLDLTSINFTTQFMIAAEKKRRRKVQKSEARRRREERFRRKQEKIRKQKAEILDQLRTASDSVDDKSASVTNVTRLFCDEPLLGQDKWLGGELSHRNGCIYGVPGSARDILKIEPCTGADSGAAVVTRVPLPQGSCKSSLSNNRFKWLRGIEAPDGCIYAIPSNALQVLKIAPGL